MPGYKFAFTSPFNTTLLASIARAARHCTIPIIVCACASAHSLVPGDSEDPPAPRVFASAFGVFAAKILPSRQCTIFALDEKGAERNILEYRLVNIPNRVFIDDTAHCLVTVDTYGNGGYAHSLVVYDRSGRKCADYRLEDILTAAEIRSRVKKSTDSRWWHEGAVFAFDTADREFDIRLAWGKVIRVDLSQGREGKLLPSARRQ